MNSSNSQILLQANGIYVDYKLPVRKYGNFKEYLLSKIKGQKQTYDSFHALTNINITLNKGECIGLIGHNGCGKSTLLKVLSGILKPRSGTVLCRERLTSLIELGAGFDSELPALDNIYLCCMLMGIPKKEIQEHIDEIIDFAELRDFLDFPIKNYSSGMTARLGFACATVIDPSIILIDEVLAVGDGAFQKKCHARIRDLKLTGKGIILVSHDMEAIKAYCDRVYVLHKGSLYFHGNTEEGISHYNKLQGIS
jgi:lipopolysaccharide transport system ATP-binding protein